MIWLAVSIFASTVLLLVDRNHAWPAFWRVSKWAACVLLLAVLSFAGYFAYQSHHKQADWFEENAPKSIGN